MTSGVSVALADLIEHVVGELGLALVQTVDGAEGDGEDIAAGRLDELAGLVGIGVDGAGLLGGTALDLGAGLTGSPWSRALHSRPQSKSWHIWAAR